MLARRFVARIPIALVFWFTAAAHAAPVFSDLGEDVARVVELIEHRLELMPYVAAWKHAHDLPIGDPDRERIVLDATVERAAAFGIEPESARELFGLQVRLARQVQEKLIDHWGAGPPAIEPSRDLQADLRPALDAIGAR